MQNSASGDIIRRYLAGELELSSAAQALCDQPRLGLLYPIAAQSEADKLTDLGAYVSWLQMRKDRPDMVPEESTPEAYIEKIRALTARLNLPPISGEKE